MTRSNERLPREHSEQRHNAGAAWTRWWAGFSSDRAIREFAGDIRNVPVANPPA